MKLAFYIKKRRLLSHPAYLALRERLSVCDLYDIDGAEDLKEGTDAVLSVGGDGTFLSASRIVAGTDVPVLGVNLGRLGFLSEYNPDEIAGRLLSGEYVIEEREMLSASVDGHEPQYALNEITVARKGAVMIGVDVKLDGAPLPTYWADGLVVATSSGSTAYSMSVGGPICTPDSKVLVISPIAPHNLNIRPLVVPSHTQIGLSVKCREKAAILTMDNRSEVIDPTCCISVSVAQFSLKRIRLGESNFIVALPSKLHWGEDVRNEE